MNEKEFNEQLKKLYLKNETYMLTEITNLYYNYYKDKKNSVTLDFVYNTLHDIWNYTDEEYNAIFDNAKKELNSKYNIKVGTDNKLTI